MDRDIYTQKEKHKHIVCVWALYTDSPPLTLPPAIFCSVCLGTLSLDGAGPLLSLAPSDSKNLLCATFSNGINHIQLSQATPSPQPQRSGAGAGGAGGMDIKVVARF